MADYSIDDILAELDAKKARQGGEAANTDISADSVLSEYEEQTAAREIAEPGSVDEVLANTERFSISDGETELLDTEDKEEEPEPIEQEPQAPKEEPLSQTEELKKQLEKQLEEEQKRELLLQKERENTDPDDMLDLVNPIEVKEKVFSEAESEPEGSDDVSHIFAGSTQDIKREQLKELPPADTAIAKKIEDEGEVKEYVTKVRPQTSLLDKLNKSLEEKRKSDLKAHRTITLTNIKNKPSAVAHPLNIDYKKQIIEATGALPRENPAVEQEKAAELGAEKKHKLKDFVLEDESGEEDEQPEEKEEEFDDYDSTGQIWADLCASHKGLKIRMGILLVITAITVIIGVLNDFDLFNTLGLDFLGFINKYADISSLMYIYLVLGVLGFAVCSTALSNGAVKLITGRADCDSVCTFTAVLSLIGGVVTLFDMQPYRMGHTFVYISAALVSLVFNTAGKLYMIVRAKRNFRFISGDSQKYYAQTVENAASASMFAKGLSDRMPVLAVMRKTEFLTDFLKSSYCDDAADRLSGKIVLGALAAGIVAGVIAFFNPFGAQFAVEIPSENALYWAFSAAIAAVTVAAPFSLMLMINRPLNITSKHLVKSSAALLGYDAVKEFSAVNTVMTDAKTLFPAGSAVIRSVKCCQRKNSVATVNIDEAIVMAASLAIHTDGILSYAFYDVTLGDKELLKKIDNCIYEDNCGVTGWIGTRRVMFGGRALMSTHHIELPSAKAERKHCASDSDEVVYLAVGGEVVAMFIICMTANPEIKSSLQELQKENTAIIVRTTDSIVTVEKLTEMFELNPALIKILPHDAHEEYEECTKYTSRGSGGLSCGGTFTSFAKGILTAKGLAKTFALSAVLMIGCAALGAVLVLLMTAFKQMTLLSPSVLTIYNTAAAVLMMIAQRMNRY